MEYPESIKLYCGNTYFDLDIGSYCIGNIFFSYFKNLTSFWLPVITEMDGSTFF